MAGNSYETVSRRKILEFLKKNSSQTVTTADIDRYLAVKDSKVNLTTIYRYLDKLEREGAVLRYADGRGSQAVYQYVEPGHHCDEHLHIKCVKCGCILHLECAFMGEIAEHIRKDHGFVLQCKNSILYGTCQKCSGRVSERESVSF